MKKYEGYHIVRAEKAGIFFGKIVEREGDTVTMTECRLIYHWEGANGLNQLAAEGVKRPSNCMFSMPVDEAEIFNVMEILKCTPEATENIKAVPEWKKK